MCVEVKGGNEQEGAGWGTTTPPKELLYFFTGPSNDKNRDHVYRSQPVIVLQCLGSCQSVPCSPAVDG